MTAAGLGCGTTSGYTTRTGCFIYFFFLLVFFLVVFNVLGHSLAGSFSLAIFATSTPAVDTIFFLLVVFNVLSYFASGFFSTIVTLVGALFFHWHVIVILILHVVIHSSHHVFNLGQLGLHPFWQIIVITQDLFQGLCMAHHGLDSVLGHVAFLIVFT